MFPGDSAQLQAIAWVSQRATDVTAQTTWSTSEPGILSVSLGGLAAALGPGTTSVSATFQNRTATTAVVVMPQGTFRLSGFVQIKDAATVPPGVAATVEVVAGVGAGMKVVAVEDPFGEFPPSYVLRGVAGSVTIRASAAGYVTQTIELDVLAHTGRDIAMVPVPPEKATAAAP
jgi:hypothetical protein